MKWFIAVTVLAAALSAQDSSVSRTTSVDINGNRVPSGPEIVQTKSATGDSTTELRQSINGRMVPVERVEEHVVKDDPSNRVIERVIHPYDRSGNPMPPTKETIEERKQPDGSSSKQTITYRGDINGNMQLYQKSATETRVSGSTQTADTVVQRQTINGSLETVEKKNAVTVKDAGGNFQENATTYRKDANGNFGEAVRTSTQHTQQGQESTDNTAEYEVGPDFRMHLHSQTVAKTSKHPDGSSDVEKDIFGTNVPGNVGEPDAKNLHLQERQLIERRPGPGDSVVQTVEVQRPTMSNPNTLSPPRQLSQTICHGKCDQ